MRVPALLIWLGLAATATPAMAGEIVVRYEPGSQRAERAAARADAGARLRRRLEIPRAQVLVAGDVRGALRELRADPAVTLAAPNRVRRAHAVPDDPLFAQQWGLTAIRAPEAWEGGVTGSAGVVVAVVDDGIAPNHTDLASRLWVNEAESAGSPGVDDDDNDYVDDVNGGDALDRITEPGDWGEHGTHVAGIAGAAGNDTTGITGVVWDVRLMSVRALDAAGVGDAASVADAFQYAADHGADVVNASLGGPGPDPLAESVIAENPDVLFVVAAGNDGVDTDSRTQSPDGEFPCNHPQDNVLCVAASDQDDALADFSNVGPRSVDITAPGVGILSSVPRTVFADDFESGELAPTWDAGSPWERVTDSEGAFVADSREADYPHNADASLTLGAPFSTTGPGACLLQYEASWAFAGSGDFVVVERSVDAGVSWQGVFRHTDASDDWEDVAAGFGAPEQAEVLLRWRLVSDTSGSDRGLSFDDLRVLCDAASLSDHDTWDGTSMATPHAAGAAALLLTVDSGARGAQLRDTLVDGSLALPDPAEGALLAGGGRLDLIGALERLELPYAATEGASEVTATSARVSGSVDPRGEPVSWSVEYGRTPAYGAVVAGGVIEAGEDPVPVSLTLEGLAPRAVHHYRVVAHAPSGSFPGRDAAFVTAAEPVTAITPPDDAPIVVAPPAPAFGDDARVRCATKKVRKRNRGVRRRVARCVVRAQGARTVHLLLRRKGKKIATGRGRAGRAIKLRTTARRKIKPRRHRLVVTLFGAAGEEATVKRRTRLR